MAPSGSNRGTPIGVGQVGAMTGDELKRRYHAKQEQIRKLEADRAWFLERGGSVPWRIGYRLEMLRIEAEELRMWGNRELTHAIREAK